MDKSGRNELENALRVLDSEDSRKSEAAMEEAFKRFDRVLWRHAHWVRGRARGVDPEEHHQALLIAVLKHYFREDPPPLENPLAWLRVVADNSARTLCRREAFHRHEVTGELDEVLELRDSGVYPRADFLLELAEEETARERALAHYEQVVWDHGTGLAKHHVRAWVLLRLRGWRAGQVAGWLIAHGLGHPSDELVWQWASRGAALLRRLAEADLDRERPRHMLALLG
jgi:DNA-directed RNA polymerase specialized sigma24 family protein